MMHPGAAGCTGCITGGPGQPCPAGTAASRRPAQAGDSAWLEYCSLPVNVERPSAARPNDVSWQFTASDNNLGQLVTDTLTETDRGPAQRPVLMTTNVARHSRTSPVVH